MYEEKIRSYSYSLLQMYDEYYVCSNNIINQSTISRLLWEKIISLYIYLRIIEYIVLLNT